MEKNIITNELTGKHYNVLYFAIKDNICVAIISENKWELQYFEVNAREVKDNFTGIIAKRLILTTTNKDGSNYVALKCHFDEMEFTKDINEVRKLFGLKETGNHPAFIQSY